MAAGVSPGGRPIDESPLSSSKSDNWVARNGGLPPYVRGIARGIAKKHGGKATSSDIAMAWTEVEKLAATSKHPAVKAAAAKAVAQEAALRARAHSQVSLANEIISSQDGSRMAGTPNFGGKKAAPFGKGGKRVKQTPEQLKAKAKAMLNVNPNRGEAKKMLNLANDWSKWDLDRKHGGEKHVSTVDKKMRSKKSSEVAGFANAARGSVDPAYRRAASKELLRRSRIRTVSESSPIKKTGLKYTS